MTNRTGNTTTVKDEIKDSHTEVQEQAKHIRRLERQAKANHLKMKNGRLREAGLTEQSKVVKKDQQSKSRRIAEARRNGRQLCQAEFTKFMATEQGQCQPIVPKHFIVNNRRMRRKIRTSITQMYKQKAVDVDDFHAEMLQVAPDLFARVLAKLWEKVGETLLIPEACNTGILVPLYKKGEQDDPANYRPLCMFSHIRKVLEKAITAELELLLKTDRMQCEFQVPTTAEHAAGGDRDYSKDRGTGRSTASRSGPSKGI